MKKFILLTLILIMAMPCLVLAKDAVPFEFITLETDDFQPGSEYSITFLDEITINAETVKGAKVNLKVSYDESLALDPAVFNEVTVGATCKYMQTIKLKQGDNTIDITVSKDGYETKKAIHLIKKKDSGLKQSLQKMIVIPGVTGK